MLTGVNISLVVVSCVLLSESSSDQYRPISRTTPRVPTDYNHCYAMSETGLTCGYIELKIIVII